MASRWARRATSVTSWPAAKRRPPATPPMAPAPSTTYLISSSSPPHVDSGYASTRGPGSVALTLRGVHHVSLNVDDVDAALAFYTDRLGLVVRPDRPDFDFPGAW